MMREVPGPIPGATSCGSAGSSSSSSPSHPVSSLSSASISSHISPLRTPLSRARTRSRVSLYSFDGNPKIVFLFLACRDLPLDFLWGMNADAGKFLYLYDSETGFVFDESDSRSLFFYGRQLSNSIKVGWGESIMIEADRLLLAAALEDLANRRFVLLSDSCVALYNFSYIYKYLMASPRSSVDSFLNVKDSRYSLKLSLIIPKDKR